MGRTPHERVDELEDRLNRLFPPGSVSDQISREAVQEARCDPDGSAPHHGILRAGLEREQRVADAFEAKAATCPPMRHDGLRTVTTLLEGEINALRGIVIELLEKVHGHHKEMTRPIPEETPEKTVGVRLYDAHHDLMKVTGVLGSLVEGL